MSELVTQEAIEWIGRETATFELEVTRSDIIKYSIAIGLRDGPHITLETAREAGYRDLVAPPGFHHLLSTQGKMLLARDELGRDGVPKDLLPPIPLDRVMAGETEVLFLEDIVAGDVIMGSERISDMYEKDGKTSKLVFVTYETTYMRPDGHTVATEQSKRIMW
jgi:3-methylfumaryl-CoA hydratase